MTTTRVHLLTSALDTAWRSALPASRSVFGSLEFARIAETHHGHPARLLVCEMEDMSVIYPFFLRSTQALSFGAVAPEAQWDTFSPEYTGPLSPSDALNHAADGMMFQAHWSQICQDTGIVAEFIHLHPWHALWSCLRPQNIEVEREIVYVDLTVPLNRLMEESFSYACRKNLRRAQSQEIEVTPANCLDDVREFHRIYIATMERNHAQARYYYPFEYFKAFYEELPDNALFMLAKYKGQTIAGTLYLHDDVDVFSYLGGADYAYQQARPTNAVIFETIRWAQAFGKKRLILGGGYKPDDGVFRFKASFSPLRAKFCVYRRIHMPSTYERLHQSWAIQFGADHMTTGYFPAYRTPVSIMEP